MDKRSYAIISDHALVDAEHVSAHAAIYSTEHRGSDGMTFLNEVSERYPNAISLAAGRPADHFCNTLEVPRWLESFVEYRSGQGLSVESVRTQIGQYSNTSGIINDIVAKYLEVDEGIIIDPRDIVITNGFQEALLIELIGIASRNGAVITVDPTYVGLSGAASKCGVQVFATPSEGMVFEAVKKGYKQAYDAGHRLFTVYVAPDFSNPSGETMELDERIALVEWAGANGVTVLEDTAYRAFGYDRVNLPSLLALDRVGQVVQLGTFSKMFLPGARVGFSARTASGRKSTSSAIDVKSFTSVATSPVSQAIVGGWLASIGFRPSIFNEERREYYKINRDLMLKSLDHSFRGLGNVAWNRPEGGFFITVDLPFDVNPEDLQELAGNRNLIVAPTSMFSLLGNGRNKIRLAFSNVQAAVIPEAISLLADFVRDRSGV